jgi:HK97 family phage major capsid protein
VLPAGYPPDQTITIPALDQTATHDVYGGVAVTWIAEGGAKAETDLHLKEVTLSPYEVAGHIVTTEKLLRNWASAETLLSTMLRKAIIGAEETAFLTGNGVGKPTGITQAGARIDYSRATASTIVIADVAGMYARLKFGGNPVWITSQTTIPQLVNIKGGNSENIWVMNAAGGLPPTLLGIPVLFHDRSPALGTAGDLVLADLSYYLIQDGSGPYVMSSDGYYFTSNKIIIKAFWNVDGKPWLSAPIPLEGSAANTVSPFIVLN